MIYSIGPINYKVTQFIRFTLDILIAVSDFLRRILNITIYSQYLLILMGNPDSLECFHFSRQVLIVKHVIVHCHIKIQMNNFQNVLQLLAIDFDQEFQYN